MRIGFDFRMGGSINAGIGRYSFELLSAILNIAPPDDTFVVFYNDLNVNSVDLKVFEDGGVELVPTRIRHYSLAEQIQLPRILNKYNLDVMHFPNFNVPLLYKKPYVVTIHDMVHHKISGHKKSRMLKFYAYKYIIQQAAERAVKIFSVTESAKKEIVDYLHVPESKVVVTYEAPPAVISSKTDIATVKKKYLLSRPYFLFVGTLERKKNIPMLTSAFDYFLETYKYDMDLVIAGKVDQHYPEVKEQAMDIKHRNRLVFTDFVSNEDQAALYQGAYAFITASLHEGFGLPGVEAMQYGLPLLASNTEVFNEVYDNAALYFDPLDIEDMAKQMNLLTSDQQFYKQMQDKSLTRSSLFDWGIAARQTFDVYHSFKKTTYEPESE